MMGLDRPEVRALIALGAETVCEGEDGSLSHLPEDLDLSGYDAALAAATAAIAAEAKGKLVAYAAEVRWRQEVGGITLAGVPVATDDRSKLMITGARVAAMADPGWSTVWHGADGGTYPIDATAMVAISDAVQAHVNSGFATFAEVKAAVEAGTIATAAEVDAAFFL